MRKVYKGTKGIRKNKKRLRNLKRNDWLLNFNILLLQCVLTFGPYILYIGIILYKSYMVRIAGDNLQLEQKDVQYTINLGWWQHWL